MPRGLGWTIAKMLVDDNVGGYARCCGVLVARVLGLLELLLPWRLGLRASETD